MQQHPSSGVPSYAHPHIQDNLQRARSPQNAARSPVHDRAPPIQVLDMSTRRMFNVKPSRTSATAASLQNGSTLCRDFLERTGCQAGAYCTSVHVMGKEHLWESIRATISAVDGTYSPGFQISCYDPQMIKYLAIPSSTITPTSGSTNFIAMFNEHGENFKARFQLCKMMFETGTCSNSTNCSDIHTSLKDVSGVVAQETHVCDEETLSIYNRLPADVIVRVYQQNSTDDFHEYPGDQVLMTHGAQQYLDAYCSDGRIPRKKMQHCAHFRLKRLCRMGPGCKFIHVVIPEGNPLQQHTPPLHLVNPLDDDTIPDAAISRSSHPRMESPRSGAESPLTEVNVIVRERSRASGYRSPLGSRTTSPLSEPLQQPRPKGMGPADVAAMLALRINTNGSAGMTPLTDNGAAALMHSRSPTRHNPYQQADHNSSSNSSFSEAKVAQRTPVSPAVTSTESAYNSPYYTQATTTVHVVPPPPPPPVAAYNNQAYPAPNGSPLQGYGSQPQVHSTFSQQQYQHPQHDNTQHYQYHQQAAYNPPQGNVPAYAQQSQQTYQQVHPQHQQQGHGYPPATAQSGVAPSQSYGYPASQGQGQYYPDPHQNSAYTAPYYAQHVAQQPQQQSLPVYQGAPQGQSYSPQAYGQHNYPQVQLHQQQQQQPTTYTPGPNPQPGYPQQRHGGGWQ